MSCRTWVRRGCSTSAWSTTRTTMRPGPPHSRGTWRVTWTWSWRVDRRHHRFCPACSAVMPGMLFRCPRCQALILLPKAGEELLEGDGTAITSLLVGPDDDEPAPPTPGPVGSAERA
eukprot:4032249-Alexandrium_andersonii.AAC.1